MAGVIMSSPSSRPAPNRPISVSNQRPVCLVGLGTASAISARIPPSPLLFARVTSPKYLMQITITSDQAISDRTPNTLDAVSSTAAGPWKHSRTA